MIKKLGIILYVVLALFSSANAGTEQLFLYSWSNYIPEGILKKFTEETGIELVYSTYDSNEEMFDVLRTTGGNGYDLILPSDYYISMMLNKGLLRKIDKTKLSNYGNLMKKRLGSNPDYGVPFFWGSTVLVVNSKKINPESIKSWNDLFKPELSGKIIFIDDLRDIFSVGLYALGYSINTEDRDQIKCAYEWLKKLEPSVSLIGSDTVADEVLAKKPTIAYLYNGDANIVVSKDTGYEAVFPFEGVPLWMDSFAIPKGAKNVDNAYAFIDFILRPDISKLITEEVMYSTPNSITYRLIDKNLRDNLVLFPTDNEIGESEFLRSVGKSLPIYERYWGMLWR